MHRSTEVVELIKKATFQISIDVGILLGDAGKDSEKAIESLLELFKTYSIPATWAVVGCLFTEYPSTMEHIMEKIFHSVTRHEIGYHSFSHVNFSQRGRGYAELEIKEGIKLAEKHGVVLKSFVFPYNAIGHADVLRENGFIIYRGQDIRRGAAKQNLFSRVVCYGIDQIISQPVDPKWRDGIWEIPASMQFQYPLLPFVLLQRAKRGVNRAILSGSVFHIWLHPQDLVTHPSLIEKLDTFLNFVAKKRDDGKILALTMGELGQMLNENLSTTDLNL